MAKQKADPVYSSAKTIIRELLKHLEKSGGLDEAGIHQLRVSSKKLRALLQLYRPYLPRETIKGLEVGVKTLADQYALSRDEAVMHATLSEIFNVHADAAFRECEARLLEQLEANETVADTIPVANPSEQLRSLWQDWKQTLPAGISPRFSKGVQYSYKRCRRLALKAQSSGRVEDFHRCRKWVKYYLYQLQLLNYNKYKGSQKYFQQLTQLADLLGVLHDRDMLEIRLRDRQATDDAEISELMPVIQQLQGWIAQQKMQDKHQCIQLFAKLFAGSSCPLLDRLLGE